LDWLLAIDTVVAEAQNAQDKSDATPLEW